MFQPAHDRILVHLQLLKCYMVLRGSCAEHMHNAFGVVFARVLINNVLCQSFPCPSPRFPFLLLCCYTAYYCFLLKNSEKNPPYVLHIRRKSLLLHPLSETERRSVDMMAGFSVLRSRVFFRSFFRTLSGPRKKSRGKVWRICGKVPIFAAAFPSRPGGAFRERLRSLKCW